MAVAGNALDVLTHGVPADALDRVAAACEALAVSGAVAGAALDGVVEEGARAVRADVGLVRVLDPDGRHLTAAAVFGPTATVAAELEGARLSAADVPAGGARRREEAPAALVALADRHRAAGILQAPATVAGRVVATVEFLRAGESFGPAELALARVLAAQLALALARPEGERREQEAPTGNALDVATAVLGAVSDDSVTESAAGLAAAIADVTCALGVVLWRGDEDGVGEVLATAGADLDADDFARLRPLAEHVLGARAPASFDAFRRNVGPAAVATLRTGQPGSSVLQLILRSGAVAREADLRELTRLASRAGRALARVERSDRLAVELEQTRALLAIVAQAIAQLSLAYTLETAIDRVADLLDIDRVAIYLRGTAGLETAAARGVAAIDAQVGERLLELALGAHRGRGSVLVPDARRDPSFRPVARELSAAGIESILGVPLVARGDFIGVLAVYPPSGRALGVAETALVGAVAGQLAVAVENARLHEQAKRLGAELEQALTAERVATRELQALYEISRTFAQSLSLDDTLEAIARAAVATFGLDAAVIRMPNERGDLLVSRAIYAADPALAGPLRAVLSRPLPVSEPPVDRLLRHPEPLLLSAEIARELDSSHNWFAPFIEKGSSVAVIPIATPAEVVGSLTILSLDPSRPITAATLETARSIAGQAALAIENARLYQQQKGFADTMQRSLLPRSIPVVPGLEIGDLYESSARVDVGGDVYDYLVLPDGRLAVVVGDVTGHGIEATADMAMAKFVFRALTREHPDPGELLASANEVLLGEVAMGKFVTMVCVMIDAALGRVTCANAGHPQPRLVHADGSVEALSASGLALGIESGQSYPTVEAQLEPGSAIVLYTDGVVEARRNGQQYGVDRLDAGLAARRSLRAHELARAIVEDCRRYTGGELTDDTAVVVIKRVAGLARGRRG
jgi:serine phosphatase RsbU (regulator of sigma subunit)